MNGKAIAIAALGGILLAGNAGATVAYNTTLASPNGSPPDLGTSTSGNNASWFNGSGNPQGGFTVVTDNGIELGLRAKQRGQLPIYWNSDNLYYVPTGLSGGAAFWNYEFSIDVRPGGVGAHTLSEYVFGLTISDGVNTQTVNPVTYWTDDSYYGNTAGNTMVAKHVGGLIASDWVAQNSENPKFGDYPLAGFFDPNAQGVYTFTLTAALASAPTEILASDTMVVSTPEPASLAVLGFACLGLIGARRRRTA
ncbi:MAG: PEP-CTERM sorting domain-containing protein [Acetobacteraceae bacterium]